MGKASVGLLGHVYTDGCRQLWASLSSPRVSQKTSQFCSGSCRAALVRYCAQAFLSSTSLAEFPGLSWLLSVLPGRWTGVFMPGSILHLKRHILGCCSDLSSCYIFVPAPSMSFTYICSVTLLFYFFLVAGIFSFFFFFSFFQLLSSKARLSVFSSTPLKAVYITCEHWVGNHWCASPLGWSTVVCA